MTIEQLPPRQRRVAELFLLGMVGSEVAAAMGLAHAAVANHIIRRAEAKLGYRLPTRRTNGRVFGEGPRGAPCAHGGWTRLCFICQRAREWAL